jgi:hypothetical protein
MIFRFVLPVLMSLLLVQCSSSKKHLYSYDYNSGKTSLLLGDQAVPPANLPEKVMRAITAANRIKDKPYRRGGGHAKIEDTAYDCSGSVSYVLHHAGLLDSPLPSSGFRKYGKKGEGEWITVYAKKGHAFLVIAGLRFDTGGNGSRDVGPRWRKTDRSLKGFQPRHPAGL